MTDDERIFVLALIQSADDWSLIEITAPTGWSIRLLKAGDPDDGDEWDDTEPEPEPEPEPGQEAPILPHINWEAETARLLTQGI